MKTTYSVLMPLWYKEKPEYLKASLESMSNQSVPPAEFVLVRDHELPEELNAVIDESTGGIPIKYVDAFELFGKGLGALLARGVEHCSYDYIARMDSDDVSLPERCEKQLIFLNANNDYAICGTSHYMLSPKNKKYQVFQLPETNEEIQAVKYFCCPFAHPTMMLRTDIIKMINYDAALAAAEDYELWFRILEKHKGYNLKERLFLYRLNNGSASYRRKKQIDEALVNIFSRNLTNNDINLAKEYVYGFFFRYKKIKDSQLDNLILKLFDNICSYSECYYCALAKLFYYFLMQGRISRFIKRLPFKDNLRFLTKMIHKKIDGLMIDS